MLRTCLFLFLAAGCDLGTVTGPGGTNPATPGVDAGMIPPGTTPQQSFTANVYPVLQAQCAGCHTTGGNANFCAATAAAAYTAIVGQPTVVGTFDPATAPLLTKIAAGHNGTAYTTTQSSAISAWLSAEKATR